MAGREIESSVSVENGNTEKFGKLCEGQESRFLPPYPISDHHRRPSLKEPADRLYKTLLRRLKGKGCWIAIQRGKGNLAVELLLLDIAVIANIDRAHGICCGQSIGADEGIGNRLHAPWLVIPLDKVPHQISLNQGSMDPVDPGPAMGGIHRPRSSHNNHRQSIAPGVIDRHGGVLEPHDIMDRCRHGSSLSPGIAVGQCHSDLLVSTEDNLRHVIATVVDK